MDSHWSLLGYLRFGLALVVAGFHLSFFVPEGDPLLHLAHFSAFVAVVVFLFVSGYSIGHSHRRRPEGFYRRRVVRILPLYLLALFFALAVGSVPGAEPLTGEMAAPRLGDVLANAVFLQGFAWRTIPTNEILWTLSVEVFFYLLTPLLARLRPSWIFVLAAGSAVVFAAARAFEVPYFPGQRWGLPVLLLAWAWLGGFWFQRVEGRPFATAGLVLPGLVVLNVNDFANRWLWPITFGIGLLCIASRASLEARPMPTTLRRLGHRLGAWSYPLYVVHYPLYLLLAAAGTPLPALVHLGLAVVLAAVLDAAFDRPIGRWLRK